MRAWPRGRWPARVRPTPVTRSACRTPHLPGGDFWNAGGPLPRSCSPRPLGHPPFESSPIVPRPIVFASCPSPLPTLSVPRRKRPAQISRTEGVPEGTMLPLPGGDWHAAGGMRGAGGGRGRAISRGAFGPQVPCRRCPGDPDGTNNRGEAKAPRAAIRPPTDQGVSQHENLHLQTARGPGRAPSHAASAPAALRTSRSGRRRCRGCGGPA